MGLLQGMLADEENNVSLMPIGSSFRKKGRKKERIKELEREVQDLKAVLDNAIRLHEDCDRANRAEIARLDPDQYDYAKGM